MSVFAQIDERLATFASTQHVRLTRNLDGSTLESWANSPGFEERRIDWKRASWCACSIHLLVPLARNGRLLWRARESVEVERVTQPGGVPAVVGAPHRSLA